MTADRPPATRETTVGALLDWRYLAWATAWSVVALVGFGLVTAIIPNPLFARRIPPEPFAIAIWLISAPLMGLVAATYLAPSVSASPATPLDPATHLGADVAADVGAVGGDDRPGVLGTAAGLAAFLAIGCPICNKLALVLLGTSGALSIWAPLQPVVGVASVILLVGTLAWRLRIRARGGTCRVPG
jgi:hypothetical protein